MLLNSPNSKAAKNVIWRGLRRRFPHCINIIEAIKKHDHRDISKQLQHFTAAAIAGALIELQAQGIPAIPDTDSLIVRQQDADAARRAIGHAMFRETRGVCVTIAGIRFQANDAASP